METYESMSKEQLIETLKAKEERFAKYVSSNLTKIDKKQVLGMCFKIACENECVLWENQESKPATERIKLTTKILFRLVGELQEEIVK